jgi:hypothetical protein
LYKRLRFALVCALLAPAAALAQENPLKRRGPEDLALLAGGWNGANLENRSHCTTPQNEGFHGTYAEYSVSFDPVFTTLGINETAVTGLTCSYAGKYAGDPLVPQWSGTYTCSDGKRGTFQSLGFLITPNAMSIRLAIKLNTSDTCDVDAILGGSRF